MARKSLVLSIAIHFLVLSGCAQNSKPEQAAGSGPPAEVQRSATPNRLAQASSPYLREHADNPVDCH